MTTDRPVIREIITKAVCGKGTLKYQRYIDLELPINHKDVQLLGNFVSNSAIEEETVLDRPVRGTTVQIKGHYDVHVWYACDQETSAAKTTVTFIEYVPITTFGSNVISDQIAVAKITEKPRCRKAYVKSLGDKTVIRVEIEQQLAAEVTGLTKVKVGVASLEFEPQAIVRGRELVPPQVSDKFAPATNSCFDLKCEDDLPEDDEDYDWCQDEYSY